MDGKREISIRLFLENLRHELLYRAQQVFRSSIRCSVGVNAMGEIVTIRLVPGSKLEFTRCLSLARGAYNEKTILDAFLRACAPGNVVYDIGSHIGIYGLAAAKVVGASGRVLAFEMDRLNFASLRRNIRRNRLANVTALNKAVSSRGGTVRYSRLLLDFGDGSPSVSTDQAALMTAEAVAVDDLVEQGVIAPPNVVKIDVEGHEFEVLRGMRRTLAEHDIRLYIEIHDFLLEKTGTSTGELLGWLNRIGYHVSEDLSNPRRTERHLVFRRREKAEA